MLPLVSREDFDDGAVLDSNGVLCGNQDKLRGVLLASAKEAAFRKVIHPPGRAHAIEFVPH